MATIYSSTRLSSGVYRVQTDMGTFMVRGGKGYNKTGKIRARRRFEIWTAGSDAECEDTNCWKCEAPNKETAFKYITELTIDQANKKVADSIWDSVTSQPTELELLMELM